MAVHARCLLSIRSITSRGSVCHQVPGRTPAEEHSSRNNGGERRLCGVVLTKLTRPFTAFDTGLAASHNGRHINLQMSSGRLKCQRFSQQHRGPARGIIDWFTFCLEPNIHPGGQKQEGKAKDKRASSSVSVCRRFLFFWRILFVPIIIFYRPVSARVHMMQQPTYWACSRCFSARHSPCSQNRISLFLLLVLFHNDMKDMNIQHSCVRGLRSVSWRRYSDPDLFFQISLRSAWRAGREDISCISEGQNLCTR